MLSMYPSARRRSWRSLIVACLALLAATAVAIQPLSADAHTTSRTRAASAARVVPRPLTLASIRSARADRTLVADAKALRLCLRSHPQACAAQRQAVQRAGSTLALAERRLAKAARAGGRHGSKRGRASTLRSPELSVSGQSLKWTHIRRIQDYVLESKVPDQAAQYSVVEGTSATPPPVPGVTVSYSVRTAVDGSAWSSEVSISYPLPTKKTDVETEKPVETKKPAETKKPVETEKPAEKVDTQAAPVLKLSKKALTWNKVGGVSTYVLMQRTAGQAAEYSAVSGSSFTPTPIPGATVYYSIRTAVDGSAWAPEVSMVFPAAVTEEPAKSEKHEEKVTPPKEESKTPPTEETTPPVETERSTGSFEMAMVPGSLAETEPGIIKELGAHSVRMEFELSSPISELAKYVEEYARQGIRVMPLVGFESTFPSPTEVKVLASWAAEFGPGGTFWQGKSYPANVAMTTIEFGNETSYTYQWSDNSEGAVASRAQTYATLFKEGYEAIHAANSHVGMLAQADDGDTGDSIWVDNMFKAVPNLGQIVAGWTVHPYGPEWATRIDALISQTQANGASSSIPIYVTEWGVASDNGRCLSDNYGWNKCMSYSEAAKVLGSAINGMIARYGSRLRAVYLYQAQDLSESGASTNRDEYFGALQYNGATKGAYTQEVHTLLTEHP